MFEVHAPLSSRFCVDTDSTRPEEASNAVVCVCVCACVFCSLTRQQRCCVCASVLCSLTLQEASNAVVRVCVRACCVH